MFLSPLKTFLCLVNTASHCINVSLWFLKSQICHSKGSPSLLRSHMPALCGVSAYFLFIKHQTGNQTPGKHNWGFSSVRVYIKCIMHLVFEGPISLPIVADKMPVRWRSKSMFAPLSRPSWAWSQPFLRLALAWPGWGQLGIPGMNKLEICQAVGVAMEREGRTDRGGGEGGGGLAWVYLIIC